MRETLNATVLRNPIIISSLVWVWVCLIRDLRGKNRLQFFYGEETDPGSSVNQVSTGQLMDRLILISLISSSNLSFLQLYTPT